MPPRTKGTPNTTKTADSHGCLATLTPVKNKVPTMIKVMAITTGPIEPKGPRHVRAEQAGQRNHQVHEVIIEEADEPARHRNRGPNRHRAKAVEQTGSRRGSCIFIRTTGESRVHR